MGRVDDEQQRGGRRPDPVKIALATLSDQRNPGALLVGPPGSGKTHALCGVVKGLSTAQKVSTGSALAGAGSLPRRQLRALLLEDADRREAVAPRVVVVDDLDTWAPGMLQLLADAVDRRAVQLVGAVRSSALDELLGRFRPALLPVVVTLRSWRALELSAYARTVLDAPLHPLAVAELVEFSGGNPLCLVELLEQGRRTGRLDRRHEVWTWSGRPTVPPVTTGRVLSEMTGVTSTVREVITTLGAFGPLPLSVLTRVHPLPELREAERSGCVVAVPRDGTVQVELRRVLEGRVAVAAAPTLRMRELVGVMSEALTSEDGHGSAAGLAVAETALALQVPMPTATLLTTAAAALDQHRPELAVALASRLAEAEGARLRVAAAMEQGCFADADADVPPPGPAEPPPSDGSAPSGSLGQPAVDGADPLRRLYADVWSGRNLVAAHDEGRRLLNSATAGAVSLGVLALTAWAALQLGRVEEALHLARSAPQLLAAPRVTTVQVLLAGVSGLGHLFRGSLQEAAGTAAELCRSGVEMRWHLPFAFGAFLAGRCAGLEARPHTALRRLSECSVSLRAAAPALEQEAITAELARAYAMAGRTAEATVTHRAGERGGASSAAAPALLRDLAELAWAETLLVTGQSAAAADVARGLAERARAADAVLVELSALHLLCRINPAAAPVAQLAEAAARTDVTLASTYARHASAAAATDRAELQDVAERYEALGLRWLAGETAATVLTGAEPHELNAAWAGRARRLLSRLQSSDQVVVPPWWGAASERVAPLTPREQEIAEAVIRGETSSQIASRLSLSRRTVENHLQHIFRKVGVSQRSDLDLVFGVVVPRRRPEGAS